MQIFLQVLGALTLAGFAALALGYFCLRWKFRDYVSSVAEQIQQVAAAEVPPFRITLRRFQPDEMCWANGEQVGSTGQELQSLGFTRIGDFRSEELPLGMRAYQHHDHQAFAVIYDHFSIGVLCDMTRRYLDGSAWTVTNRPWDGMDRPEWSVVRWMPDASMGSMLQCLLESSPGTDYRVASADRFVEMFETAYARESNWRIRRGGVSEEEVRRVAGMQGQEPTAESVLRIQTKWKNAISEFLSRRMVKAWQKKVGGPIADLDLEDCGLIGVHERMTPGCLLALVDEEYYEGAEFEEVESEDENGMEHRIRGWRVDLAQLENAASPTRAFQALIRSRSIESRFQLISRVREPISGEIWLMPNRKDDGEGMDLSAFDDVEHS